MKQQVEEKQSQLEKTPDESVLVPSGQKASGEAALSGEAKAEITRELDELFARELDMGNSEGSQNKGVGVDLERAVAPGQDVFHGRDFHVDVFPRLRAGAQEAKESPF